MQKITLTITDDKKTDFFLELMKQLEFVEVHSPVEQSSKDDYHFFESAGLWKDREIDAEELRKKAWSR